MDRLRGNTYVYKSTSFWRGAAFALFGVTLGFTLCQPAVVSAQTPTKETALVFDNVTVIDVSQGNRIAAQRVVISGNRIKEVGSMSTVKVPSGARVVDANGKYLIPGLWDMHVHPRYYTKYFYPLFLANGVTGIRDGWSDFSLDTTRMWQREILAGTRVGPPRQLLPGPALDQCDSPRDPNQGHSCVTDAADARHVVDSLKAAGAGYIKTYQLGPETYFAVAAEARKIGIPFGGHLTAIPAVEASDSGATFIDHLNTSGSAGASVYSLCINKTTTVAQCQSLVERFRHNNTWFIPTLARFAVEGMGSHRSVAGDTVLARFDEFARRFWADSARDMDLRHGPADATRLVREAPRPTSDSGSSGLMLGALQLMAHLGMPLLAGTDDGAPVMKHMPPGFTLHSELALYVAEGLTPLQSLQTATLNPALALHATDSLGTVAAGKLADVILLDADPLADIDNTTKINAVVANGRYFDRASLDKLVAEARAGAPAGGR